MLQLLVNTGAEFEDEDLALEIIEETLKDTAKKNNDLLHNVSKKDLDLDCPYDFTSRCTMGRSYCKVNTC